MRNSLILLPILLAATLSAPRTASAAEPTPTIASASALRDIRAGRPIVVHVTVPLCSNEQIDCGSDAAGNPGRLETNLYWGAAFGHRRFFDRKKSGFTRVDLSKGSGSILERTVYRRLVSALPFGGREGETVELLLVLEAYHGDSIDKAVAAFHERATQGGVVRFRDGEREREERISIAGYAGHNRLMDGTKLPASARQADRDRAIPSFVLACYSEFYFGPPLREAGSRTLLMTRSLMAPEGYVLDAVVSGIAKNEPETRIRERAVAAYAKWQHLSRPAAGTIFAPSSP